MDIPTSKTVTDIVELVAWIWAMWAMVKAARTFTNPDPGLNHIRFVLRRIEIVLRRLNFQLAKVEEAADRNDSNTSKKAKNNKLKRD